jgi:hypothetical protein
VTSSIQTPRSSSQSKKLPQKDGSISTHSYHQQEKSIKTDSDDRTLTQKDSFTEQTASRRSSVEQRPYNHDVLVIQTQPPKVNNNYHGGKHNKFPIVFLHSLNHYLIYSIDHNRLQKVHRLIQHQYHRR